jgi:DNA invertase Pin-like site-specific DNA recombinase
MPSGKRVEAHIRSQPHEGWRLVKTQYDDGGYSGGTLECPALKGLLADLRAGTVQVVVVYKLDRLSHWLSDFAQLIEVFDKRGVSFVSVTRQFNTNFHGPADAQRAAVLRPIGGARSPVSASGIRS